MLERRLSHMKGETVSDDQSALEARVTELKADLDAKTAVHSMLTAQMKRLQVDN